MMGPKRDSRVKKPTSSRSYGSANESQKDFKTGITGFKAEGQGDGNHLVVFPNMDNTYSDSFKEEIEHQLGEFIDPGQSHPVKGPCAICGLPCKTCCGACKKAFYCAKKHQQLHWAKHKLECRPFSIPPQYPAGWSTTTSASKNRKTKVKDEEGLELKYMIATREIEGGKTLFSEKPLLIAPNYPSKAADDNISKKCCCLGCYKQFPIPGRFVPLDVCKTCLLPLCADCLKDIEGHRNLDCSHSQDQCQAVADAVTKNRQFMTDKNVKLGHNADLIKDFTILRLLMIYKSNFVRWENFIELKSHSRYAINLRFPTDETKEWLAADYPISENYLTSLKDKSVKLEDVIRIYSIFSEVSFSSSHIRIIFTTQVWIPHACSPNSQPYFKEHDTSHTIYVKTIEAIRSDGVISMNYLWDYDDGNSKSAIRLFASSGLYCAETRCHCRMSSSMDTSVGIRCNVLQATRDTLGSCPGYLSPVMEAPNPEKQNLGMLIYIKSKSWSCNKCRKAEKFSSIQKQVREIGDCMKAEVEKYCADPDAFSYMRLKELLAKNVSEHHWLYWRVCRVTLTCLSNYVGNGYEMLSMVIGMPQGEIKSNFIKLICQKVEMYGNGVIESTVPKIQQTPGVLTVLAKRHGRLSSKRSNFLFDAFYANLIVFAENFKQKFVTLSNNTSTISEAIIDSMRCVEILVGLLEEAALSLGLCLTNENRHKAAICSKMLEVFKSLQSKAIRNRPNVLQYIREFLEMYANQDTAFISTTLPKFKPMKDDLEDIFDPDGRQYISLTFGPAYGDGQDGKKKNEKSFKSFKEDEPSGAEKLPTWRDRLSDSDDDIGSFGDVLDDDDDLDDLTDRDYYELLMNNSIRESMYAEHIFRNMYI